MAKAIAGGGIVRMWINQPSTLQPYHAYHGRRVLAHLVDGDYARAYFTDGPVVSMRVAHNALSEGWPAREEGDT